MRFSGDADLGVALRGETDLGVARFRGEADLGVAFLADTGLGVAIFRGDVDLGVAAFLAADLGVALGVFFGEAGRFWGESCSVSVISCVGVFLADAGDDAFWNNLKSDI